MSDSQAKSFKKTLLCVAVSVLLMSAGSSVGQYASTNEDVFDQLPDLGSKSAKYLSDYDAQRLGKAFIRQSRSQQPYVYDPELVAYINRLGNRLLDVSDDAGKEYHFYLIDDNVINAFAVPGGHIALHTAILTKSESESEVASVVGHEIAHVTQRHIARQIESSRYDSIIALGTLLAAAAVGGAEGAQAGLSLGNASILDRKLRYGRSYESEADSLGIRLLSKAGFEPEAMPRFFKRLLDESRINKSNAPEFLRSHPLTINRIAESSERVRAYPKAGKQDQQEFFMMQAKTIASYAKDKEVAREQFATAIKNGKNTIANRYGYALALSKNNEYAEARNAFNNLVKDYPDNVSIRLAQADNELDANNIEKGLALLKTLYQEQIALGNHIVDIYYANALVLTDRNKESIPILRAALANDPTEPYLHSLLSRAYAKTGDEMESYRERGESHYLLGHYTFSIRQFKRALSLADSSYEKARIKARISDVESELAELKR